MFELFFQQSLMTVVREKVMDYMKPRSDLVKLFICSTCSLQAALCVVTGHLSKVVGRLKDGFKGYCAKCLSVI